MNHGTMMRSMLAGLWLAVTFTCVGCAGEGESSGQSSALKELGYCDVEPLMERYCVRCHGDPVTNYAPFSLNTWESTQVIVSPETGELMWERMALTIRREFMPLLQLELDPPVEPLLGKDRQMLLDWLSQGAPLGEACE